MVPLRRRRWRRVVHASCLTVFSTPARSPCCPLAVAEPEAGVEPLPPLPTKGGGDKQQQQQKEQQAKEAAAAAAAAELELEEEMQEEAHSGKAPTPEKAAGGGMPKNETKAATPELSEAELEQLQEEEGERRRRTLRRRRAW